MSDKMLEGLVTSLSTLGVEPTPTELTKLFSGVITKIDPDDYSTLFINNYLAGLGQPIVPANVPALITQHLSLAEGSGKKGDILLYNTSEGFSKLGIIVDMFQQAVEQEIEERDSLLLLSVDNPNPDPLHDYRIITTTRLVSELTTVLAVDVIKILRCEDG